MDIRTYYKSLTKDERAAFAERAETSCKYIELHLLPRRKIPRRQTMERLAEASMGAISYEDIVRYFMLAA